MSNSETSSNFNLSHGSTTSSGSSKIKHRVRIESISKDTIHSMFNDRNLQNVDQNENGDDGSTSTRSSGSPPPLKQIRRNRTISGSKSEDHLLTMPSGQVSPNLTINWMYCANLALARCYPKWLLFSNFCVLFFIHRIISECVCEALPLNTNPFLIHVPNYPSLFIALTPIFISPSHLTVNHWTFWSKIRGG